MASLLAREAFGAPIERREELVDNVVIGMAVQVFQFPDGSLSTGLPYAVSTTTIIGTPSSESTPIPSSSGAPIVAAAVKPTSTPEPTPTPKPTPTPSPEPISAAVFAAAEVPSSSVAPVVISTPEAVAVKPTTLATVVAPSSVAPVVVPTPSKTSTPISGGGSKQGLGYNDASLLEGFVGSDATWAYDWSPSPLGTVPSAFNYVPMLWGLDPLHLPGFDEAVEKALASGSTHILGFNEPDHPEQANLSPQAAADGWFHLEAYADRASLGSPAISNGGDPQGISWLTEFLDICSSCTIDFVAFHWYDSAENFAYFQQHVEDVHAAAGGRKLWLTEFGASGSDDQQKAFLAQAIPYLNSLDYVERYAYYYVAEGFMVTGGTPNEIGRAFTSIS